MIEILKRVLEVVQLERRLRLGVVLEPEERILLPREPAFGERALLPEELLPVRPLVVPRQQPHHP